MERQSGAVSKRKSVRPTRLRLADLGPSKCQEIEDLINAALRRSSGSPFFTGSGCYSVYAKFRPLPNRGPTRVWRAASSGWSSPGRCSCRMRTGSAQGRPDIWRQARLLVLVADMRSHEGHAHGLADGHVEHDAIPLVSKRGIANSICVPSSRANLSGLRV